MPLIPILLPNIVGTAAPIRASSRLTSRSLPRTLWRQGQPHRETTLLEQRADLKPLSAILSPHRKERRPQH